MQSCFFFLHKKMLVQITLDAFLCRRDHREESSSRPPPKRDSDGLPRPTQQAARPKKRRIVADEED